MQSSGSNGDIVERMYTSSEPLRRFYHPVLASSLLKKKPVGIEILGQKVALFRDGNGAVSAVEDRCPHRFSPLSLGKVAGGTIECPYHGWKVDSKGAVVHPTDGALKHCAAKTYSSYEDQGMIWLAASTEAKRPEPLEPNWYRLGSYSIEFKTPFHVAFDNFSEDEHFPYVHKVLGWNEKGAKDVKFEFSHSDDRINVRYLGPQRSFPGMRLFMLEPGDYFRNTWETRFDPVCTTYVAVGSTKDGIKKAPLQQRVAIYFVPNNAGKTTLHVIQYATFDNPKWNWTLALTRRLALAITRWDLNFDRDFTEKLGQIPYSFRGMRLGKYDQPLFHGRKLLEKIYFGVEKPPRAEPRIETLNEATGLTAPVADL